MKIGIALALFGAATLISTTAFAQGAPAAKPAEAKPAAAPKPAEAAKPAEGAKPAVAEAKPDPKKEAMMKKMMEAQQKYAALGPEHEALKKAAGTWTVTAQWWEDPKAPPQESTGTATFKMALGDRFLVEEFSGTMMGQPFMGMGVTGFNNMTKKYENDWRDNMMTGTMRGEGTADKTGKVITFKLTGVDMFGKKINGKEVMTHNDDGTVTVEIWMNAAQKAPNGKMIYKKKA